MLALLTLLQVFFFKKPAPMKHPAPLITRTRSKFFGDQTQQTKTHAQN
jgi:hypothetical protein